MALQPAAASSDAAEPEQLLPAQPLPAAAPVSASVPSEVEPLRELTPRQRAQAERAQSAYVRELVARLQKQRFYPAQARKDKATGAVKLRFTVDASGQVLSAQIAGSAGHAALDAAALEVLRLASPLPPIPKRMQRSRLTITVPIDFALTTE